jgi:thiamine kinase-like enzyme
MTPPIFNNAALHALTQNGLWHDKGYKKTCILPDRILAFWANNPHNRSATLREANATRIAAVSLAPLHVSVPNVKLLGLTEDGQLITQQPRLEGMPLFDWRRQNSSILQISALQSCAHLGQMMAQLHYTAPTTHIALTTSPDATNWLLTDPTELAADLKAMLPLEYRQINQIKIFAATSQHILAPYAEARVFCHNDIHPKNIIVNDEGEISGLIDFEQACINSPLDELGKLSAMKSRAATAVFLNAYNATAQKHYSPLPRLTQPMLHFTQLAWGITRAKELTTQLKEDYAQQYLAYAFQRCADLLPTLDSTLFKLRTVKPPPAQKPTAPAAP